MDATRACIIARRKQLHSCLRPFEGAGRLLLASEDPVHGFRIDELVLDVETKQIRLSPMQLASEGDPNASRSIPNPTVFGWVASVVQCPPPHALSPRVVHVRNHSSTGVLEVTQFALCPQNPARLVAMGHATAPNRFRAAKSGHHGMFGGGLSLDNRVPNNLMVFVAPSPPCSPTDGHLNVGVLVTKSDGTVRVFETLDPDARHPRASDPAARHARVSGLMGDRCIVEGKTLVSVPGRAYEAAFCPRARVWPLVSMDGEEANAFGRADSNIDATQRAGFGDLSCRPHLIATSARYGRVLVCAALAGQVLVVVTAGRIWMRDVTTHAAVVIFEQHTAAETATALSVATAGRWLWVMRTFSFWQDGRTTVVV